MYLDNRAYKTYWLDGQWELRNKTMLKFISWTTECVVVPLLRWKQLGGSDLDTKIGSNQNYVCVHVCVHVSMDVYVCVYVYTCVCVFV